MPASRSGPMWASGASRPWHADLHRSSAGGDKSTACDCGSCANRRPWRHEVCRLAILIATRDDENLSSVRRRRLTLVRASPLRCVARGPRGHLIAAASAWVCIPGRGPSGRPSVTERGEGPTSDGASAAPAPSFGPAPGSRALLAAWRYQPVRAAAVTLRFSGTEQGVSSGLASGALTRRCRSPVHGSVKARDLESLVLGMRMLRSSGDVGSHWCGRAR